jgi:hypothetical protein
LPQNIDTETKAFPAVGIDIHAKEAFGLETEVEDQGLDTEAQGEALEMRALSLMGTDGDIETEAGDITVHEAIGSGGAFSSAFKQATKAINAVGIALDFMAVERVGPPVLEFEHWGQADIFFGGPEMDVPFYGLP